MRKNKNKKRWWRRKLGEIIHTGLPDLPGLEAACRGILCSAVLQHIPDTHLYESLQSIRELTEIKGIFVISFPVNYHGIDPKTSRDP